MKAEDLNLTISDMIKVAAGGYSFCLVPNEEVSANHIPVLAINLIDKLASETSINKEKPTIPCHGGANNLLGRAMPSFEIEQSRTKNRIDFQKKDKPLSTSDAGLLIKAIKTISNNMADPAFNVNQLSCMLHVSRATLFRKIKVFTGMSPNQLIRSLRLVRAAQLLHTDYGNITTIAFEVGFSSSSYFTKCFKNKYSLSPSEFKLHAKRKNTN